MNAHMVHLIRILFVLLTSNVLGVTRKVSKLIYNGHSGAMNEVHILADVCH